MFSTRFISFVKSFLGISEETGIQKDLNMSKTSFSASNILGGDIVKFNYKNKNSYRGYPAEKEGEHLVLVLGSFKGKSGSYLKGLKLNGIDAETAGIVTGSLYKKRDIRYGPSTAVIFGNNNYRTYITNRMYDFHECEVKRSKK